MALSDEGQALDPQWIEAGNNVYGTLRGVRDASSVAELFVRAGWRSRSSSWHGYEVSTSWCEAAIDPTQDSDILLHGTVAPHHINDLAALLDRFGLKYSLELYNEDDTLAREIQT